MRITDKVLIKTLVDDLQRHLERMADAQKIVSSGKVLHKPSDDPRGVARSLEIRTSLDSLEQYEENISEASLWLNSTESSLGSADEVLIQAKQEALLAVNATSTPEMRTASAFVIQDLKESLTDIANTKIVGKYIFSGFKTTTKPFEDDGTYNGDTGEIIREVGPAGFTVAINVNGEEAFKTGEDVFDVLQDLVDGLNNNDTQTIQTQIERLEVCIDNVIEYRGKVGSRATQLEFANTQLTDSQTTLTSLLSDIEDADIVQAVMELSTAQNVYQASLLAGSTLFQTSLIDFLK